MLETYRVTLVQRPPDLYMDASVLSLHAELQPDHSEGLDAILLGDVLRSFLSPHLPLPGRISCLDSRILLSTLAMLSWHVRTTSAPGQSLGPSWKKDNIELALHRWYSHVQIDHGRQSSSLQRLSDRTTLLFHLVVMNIQVNMQIIHKFVRLHRFQQPIPQEVQTELNHWTQSKECEIALWHAKEIMDFCESQMNGPRRGWGDQSVESPHTAIAVYIASLVLWASRVALLGPDARATKTKAARSELESGIHVLGYLQVRIAESLLLVLQGLSVNAVHPDPSNQSPT